MAKRVVLFVLGGVLLVIGALAAIGGGALMALFGSNDTRHSGVQHVATPTSGRADRARCPGPAPVRVPASAGPGSRALAIPGRSGRRWPVQLFSHSLEGNREQILEGPGRGPGPEHHPRPRRFR